MRWTLRKGVVAAALLIGAVQLFPYRVQNPKQNVEPAWDSSRTRQLAVAACFDCHSNRTRLPWYDKIAPVSWWVTRHVEDGRRALNFSEADSRVPNWADSIETVRGGSMPPGYYTWLGLHRPAHLTAAERAELARGFRATSLGGR